MSTSMDYEQQLRADMARVEEYLKGHFAQREPRADLYDAMNYSLLSGGKRLRPVLTLAVCRMCGGDIQTALPFACAVEMVHTYSLIHDDLPCMDDDDLRRGRPTNHKVYGQATAVLAGDALLTAAFETIAEHGTALPADKALAISACLGAAAGARGMVGGQVLDMAGEGHALSLSEVEELQKLKTGALITAAAEIGCIVAGAGEAERAAVRRYSQNLGLAFQIQDDILDVVGDQSTLGKPIGSDAQSEKTTFVALKGVVACRNLVQEKTNHAKAALLERFQKTEFLCWLADHLVGREN
ncbi:geranyltranstransferase [uncultured Eubacteriales bacterium]|uniref:Farnesyl diphosphate synthase n=1 Tax=uncultured Eubacteriales bacterium TaxID=172733 RepID=A0A212JVG2_9FIRM|nr:geranyltranstransferase [uncultured Eubacteriales bacterium]